MVGNDLSHFVMDCFQVGRIPRAVNDTIMVLIPKILSPVKLTHYRPFSLCNVSYKLVTKFIMDHIKDILPSLIGVTQSSFVPKRQITDNVVVVQEVLHSMNIRKNKKGIIMIKLDLKKAYDRLNWDFIRDTLVDIGMLDNWVSLIVDCICSNSFRLFWNGEPSEEFLPSPRIRQGDP